MAPTGLSTLLFFRECDAAARTRGFALPPCVQDASAPGDCHSGSIADPLPAWNSGGMLA